MKDRLDQEERDQSIVPNHCFGERKGEREGRGKGGGEKREGEREGLLWRKCTSN